MTRHVLIRTSADDRQLVEEAAIPTEAELHDALTQFPALLPASDLGLEDLVVIGRESTLTGGRADLVLADARGRLCIVEVKNDGNPDTRRVVAQLLDYAASLFGQSVEEVDQLVLQPFLAAQGRTGQSIGEYIAEESGVEDADVEAIAEQLGQTLAAGDFTLVVAAPQIPIGVQRVLEYLNARGQRFFGLEVSYFRGPVECFVPRVVVKPLTSDPGGGGTGGKLPVAEAAFFEQMPERAREPVRQFLTTVADAGAHVAWRTYGPSILVRRGKRRQIAYVEAQRLAITLKASGDFPQEPFDDAAQHLRDAGIGSETKDGWYRTVSFAETDEAALADALGVATRLVENVSPTVAFEDLPTPLAVTLVPNDHNVWVRHVPELDHLLGQHLRGRLADPAAGQEAQVWLFPLAGGQPGWRPQFTPHSAQETLWSPATNKTTLRLVVDGASG